MFTQPSLFKRLMFSILTLSFLLWCVVLFLMVFQFKKIHEMNLAIHLEAAAQQQLTLLKAIADDNTIHRYAEENDLLQKKFYKKLSVFVAPYQVQIWHGEHLVFSPADLPITKPLADAMQQLITLPFTSQSPTRLTWSAELPDRDLTVRVVEETPFGFSLSLRSMGFYLIPFFVSVPFLFFPVWWAVSRGLRPLNQVAEAIVARTDVNLSKIGDSPYRELSPIVNAVNRLMEKISLRIQREQEFLHDAAHELKTPLAVIQLNSELLASTTDSQTQQMALEGIQKGVTRATRTTHQLLASARADHHHARVPASATVQLRELLQDRLAHWMSLAMQKQIDIELAASSPCELRVDLESITLLIDNLIDNAIKYSDEGSAIQVRLTEEPTHICLQVIDEGCGIPDEFQEKVFERFFRLNPSESHGTGLGLSIAMRAAQQHHATIELSNNIRAKQGLVVTVKFYRSNEKAS